MNGERLDNNKKDIQWHPAFVSAMSLELWDHRNDLVFERERNLNTKPLEIDLLIIKKEKDSPIRDDIWRFFRKHNILEYKAPGDRLNVDSYYKALAYACLYKSYGETVDSRKADDITVSLIRDSKPEGLLRLLEGSGSIVTNVQPGVYHLSGANTLFPTQVVVTGELTGEGHAFLKVLTRAPQKSDLSRFLDLYKGFRIQAEREYAESILEVFTKANRKWMELWKGEDSMGTALMEIMAPELQEAKNKGIEEGIEKGILGAVDILRGLGLTREEIKNAVMARYSLTDKETDKFL